MFWQSQGTKHVHKLVFMVVPEGAAWQITL